jgi:pimeloyl-ACP methyl ester carboxylesterase
MAIVFVHGLFPANFDLPSGWLFPDLPGYGSNCVGGNLVGAIPHAVEFVRGLITEPAHIVGHSIGGAIAVELASRYPECVRSLINVEGNFTLKDAFWSSTLARMTDSEAEAEVVMLRSDPSAWLRNADVPVTPRTLASAQRSLQTSALTIQSMARSVVEITSEPRYLDDVRTILGRGIPFHLIAGERSRAGWDVPDFVLARAASFQIQPDAGHMLMMNDPTAFAELVERVAR